MVNLRCLSKPFKRVLFNHADILSENISRDVYQKYILKFINKSRKRQNLEKIKYIKSPSDIKIFNFLSFSRILKMKLNRESSLAHSKVREYWLRRGPRLLLSLLITLGINILLSKIILNERNYLYSILLSLNITMFTLYMLYKRLPDSIHATMMRTGHIYYNQWKSS